MVARTSNGVDPKSGVECRKAGANTVAHAESWRRADTQGSERKLMTTATQQERRRASSGQRRPVDRTNAIEIVACARRVALGLRYAFEIQDSNIRWRKYSNTMLATNIEIVAVTIRCVGNMQNNHRHRCMTTLSSSFIQGLKPSFSANPSHRSLPFLAQD